MAIRKQVIKNLHFRHGPPPAEKLFIRLTKDEPTTLRDLDDLDTKLTRKSVEKKYGALARASVHPSVISLAHFSKFLSLFGNRVTAGPRDENGNATMIFDIYEPAKNARA